MKDPKDVKTTVACPYCAKRFTENEIRKLWNTFVSRYKGSGRPPLPPEKKCPCGAMSKRRAKLRKHVCEAPAAA